MTLYEYKVKTVKRIVDGDTYDFEVDLGFGITNTQRFRLHGYDTPETYRPSCDAEYQHGIKATEFVEKAFFDANEIYVKSHKLGIYGRYEAEVFVVINGVKHSLGDMLVASKLIKLESY